jgi:hypothetical protein
VANQPEEEPAAPTPLEAQSVATGAPDVGRPAVVANFSLRPPHMTVHAPPNEPHFLVTSEQIETLRNHGRDGSLDWSLALGGAAAGLLQNLFNLIGAITKPEVPGTWDVVATILFSVCAAGAVAKYTQHRANQTRMDDYVARIKSGPPVNIS